MTLAGQVQQLPGMQFKCFPGNKCGKHIRTIIINNISFWNGSHPMLYLLYMSNTGELLSKPWGRTETESSLNNSRSAVTSISFWRPPLTLDGSNE